jgi:hypothetical protein
MNDNQKVLLGVLGLGIGAVAVYFLTKPRQEYINYPLPGGGYAKIPTYYGTGTPIAEVPITNPITGETIGIVRAYTPEQLNYIYKVLMYQGLADLIAKIFKPTQTTSYSEYTPPKEGGWTLARPLGQTIDWLSWYKQKTGQIKRQAGIGQPIPRERRFGEIL